MKQESKKHEVIAISLPRDMSSKLREKCQEFGIPISKQIQFALSGKKVPTKTKELIKNVKQVN